MGCSDSLSLFLRLEVVCRNQAIFAGFGSEKGERIRCLWTWPACWRAWPRRAWSGGYGTPDRMKDGTTHRPTSPSTGGSGHRRVFGRRAEGDTTTLEKTLNSRRWTGTDGRRPGRMCDRQGLSLSVLKALDDGPWKTGSPSPSRKVLRAGGDGAARRAVTNNRTRLLSLEIVDPLPLGGGMRRTWLRGRENVHKRYLLHVAGHNLSLLMPN